MSTNTNVADTLNELTLFINDRIEGYKHAAADSKAPEHKTLYQQLVSQSQQFSNELNGFASSAGGDAETSTTAKGKFFRGWMDAKAALTGHDEQAILNSNVYGEEWALKAYKDALDDHDLPAPVRQAVERQYQISQETYQQLKSLGGVSHP
ncbi:MAG TPA: PA2169 family four-helix-bundle protein [Hymenobacter sp.]|jgi:uncharacterized protein (TIGR02284 family)